MTIRRGTLLALAAALVVGACGPGAGAATGPRPAETRFTTAAKLQLAQAEAATGERRQELYRQALAQSLQGVEAQPGNPQHHFLAGVAHAGLGDFEDAAAMWNQALEIYPAYGEEVMIAREQAWAQAFNDGVNAYNVGDMQEAVAHWRRANMIFDRRPEAYFNLAAVYSAEQRYDEAISAFRQAVESLDRDPGRELSEEEVEEREESRISALQNLGNLQLFTEQFADAERTFRRITELQPDNIAARSTLAAALARQNRSDEAMAVYQELMGMPGLTGENLMSIGVGLFQAEQYSQAADAFRRLTEMQRYNRDAWYNYLNALYAQARPQAGTQVPAAEQQQRWQRIVPVGEQLLEIDPLNETAYLILVESLRQSRQQPRALQMAERNIGLPIHLDEMQLRHDAGRITLRGTASGNRARQGTPVRLEFTFYGAEGQALGTETVTVTAPAQNATAPLQVSLASETAPVGYRYRVLE
jgi:tetratricopeptide (TPR) repeat protein